MVLILMGVTGSGKTTVGRALADALHCEFADADDFHSAANRAKMHAGIPLDGADRAPWLRSLHDQITEWLEAGKTAVLACSALRESYRAELVQGTAPGAVQFILLQGPASLIYSRLEARKGHYMPASLLRSQIDTLEPPHGALEISVTKNVPAIVREIMTALWPEGYAEHAGTEGGL